jgi:hypothetical protein
MAQVVLQPSFGNKAARQHWKDTLDQEVVFTAGGRAETLTDLERKLLEAMHPSGAARFWGGTAKHDKRMATLSTGDIILFTGKNHVRGVGEVGVSFRNAEFADTMWDRHPTNGSYCNVYSLLSFQPTLIPYTEIWDLPGFNAGDNFMGTRFLDKEKAATVIDGLGICTNTTQREESLQEQLLTEALTGGKVIPAEAVKTAETSYTRPGGETLVRRAESLLVAAYRATLDGHDAGRIRTLSGVADLYVRSTTDVEIIEAKRDAGRRFVREALGQLLDYVLHAPDPVTRLGALFPARPSQLDVQLLHRYGIDCIHRITDGSFERLPAPSEQRDHMLKIWLAGKS